MQEALDTLLLGCLRPPAGINPQALWKRCPWAGSSLHLNTRQAGPNGSTCQAQAFTSSSPGSRHMPSHHSALAQGTGLQTICTGSRHRPSNHLHWLKAQAFKPSCTGSKPLLCSACLPGGGLQDAVPTPSQSLHQSTTHSYLPVWASRLLSPQVSQGPQLLSTHLPGAGLPRYFP